MESESKMATVTLNPVIPETPSGSIIAAANKPVTTVDARGRSIVVKKLVPLARMRLFAIAGPELAKNEQWLGYAALAASVVSIDGDAVSCNTLREIEFTVQALDDDGLTAVALVVAANFSPAKAEDAIESAKN
jgi:hypothetical protein